MSTETPTCPIEYLVHPGDRLNIGYQLMLWPWLSGEHEDDVLPVRQWLWGLTKSPKVLDALSEAQYKRYTRGDACKIIKYGLDALNAGLNLWDWDKSKSKIVRSVLVFSAKSCDTSAEYQKYMFGLSGKWIKAKLTLSEAIHRNNMRNTLWRSPLSEGEVKDITRDVYKRYKSGAYTLSKSSRRRRHHA